MAVPTTGPVTFDILDDATQAHLARVTGSPPLSPSAATLYLYGVDLTVCLSLTLIPLPLMFSYKFNQSCCETGYCGQATERRSGESLSREIRLVAFVQTNLQPRRRAQTGQPHLPRDSGCHDIYSLRPNRARGCAGVESTWTWVSAVVRSSLSWCNESICPHFFHPVGATPTHLSRHSSDPTILSRGTCALLSAAACSNRTRRSFLDPSAGSPRMPSADLRSLERTKHAPSP